MIPNSLLPRKGENEKIFTRLGEVVLGGRGQGSGVRGQGSGVSTQESGGLGVR